MASSDSKKPGKFGHRMMWLALAIAAMIAAYVAGWHYVANRVHVEATSAIAGMNREGRRANCENTDVRGFPFRIGIFCRSVLYEDARAGIGFRASGLRSAAQVYAPQRVVAELDGPALVEFPGFSALDVNWSSLRAGARIAQPIPDLVSLEALDLRAALDSEPANGASLLSMDRAEFHMRPTGRDLDLAVRFSGLRADPSAIGGRLLPPMQGLADIVVDGGVDVLPGLTGLRGLSGTIRTFSLTLGGNEGARITGPFDIGLDGLINARLDVTVQNPRALAATLAEIMPEARGQIEAAFSGLVALGDEPTLPLIVNRGTVRMGFLTLGQIPPLD
jgi:hypothetical protein